MQNSDNPDYTDIVNILTPKQAFIFDMDGTIVDLEELNYRGYADTIKKFFNKDLSKDEYQRFISGTRTAKAFQDALENEGVGDYRLEDLIDNFRRIKRENLMKYTEEVTELKPGIAEFLQTLKKNERQTCLATSTIREFTELILKFYNLKQYFDQILTAEDVLKGKPDPEIYNLSLERLGIEKAQAVIFEDSKRGIASAKNAGIFCIGILTKGLNETYVSEADYVIEDYVTIKNIYST